MQAVEIFASCERGQYIPKFFANAATYEWDWGVADEHEAKRVLMSGPDHEEYWDVWATVLDNAKFNWLDNTWWLAMGENGDLFTICPELMTEEEKENFGLEE